MIKIAGVVYLTSDHKTFILDVQVVGTWVALSEAYETKTNKYKTPDLLRQISPLPVVSSESLPEF